MVSNLQRVMRHFASIAAGLALLLASAARAEETVDPHGLPALRGPAAEGPVTPESVGEGEDRPSDKAGRFSLSIENDLLGAGTDRNYTAGTRLAWLTAPAGAPAWLNRLLSAAPRADQAETVRLMLEAGQSMFTPETLSAEAPPEGERPYAGWLYLGLSALVDSEDTLDRAGLLLGVLGPAAGAGSVQEAIHGLLGMTDPEGWASQPDSRLGFAFLLDRFWRFIEAEPLQAMQLQVLPHVGLAAGNVFSHTSAGVLLRIGNDLASEPIPATIAPGLAPGGGSAAADADFRWSFFLDLGGRAVAHNVLVEGLDGEGPEARPLVSDMTAGLTIAYAGLTVTYARTWRSPEAVTQQDGDAFGDVTISVDY